MKKVNTVAYNPQTDGLVEKMNHTLRSMIAKHTRKFGREWDVHLQQLLFAYRVKPQNSTQESPFFLPYGRDAHLPTETALSQPLTPYMVDLDDYRTALVTGLTESWKNAKQNIARVQKHQKQFYDRSSKAPNYQTGDRVMVYMPSENSGKLRKLALPYYGPYRVLDSLQMVFMSDRSIVPSKSRFESILIESRNALKNFLMFHGWAKLENS